MSHISTTLEFDFWEFVSCGICRLEYIDEPGVFSSTPFWLTECGHVVCNNHLSMSSTLVYISDNLTFHSLMPGDPDRSCAECGSTGIRVLAMAKDVRPQNNTMQEIPHSQRGSWSHQWPTGSNRHPSLLMRSVIHFGCMAHCAVPVFAFTHACACSQFQLNTIASLVRFYKKKYLQYRPLYERLKEEHAEAKRLRKYSFALRDIIVVAVPLNHTIRLVDDLRGENQALIQRLQELGGSVGDNLTAGKRRRIDNAR